MQVMSKIINSLQPVTRKKKVSTAMVPGNPDAISHAYAMEEKKSHDLLKEIQEQITSE